MPPTEQPLTLELNRIYQGDCRDILYQLPEKSVDLIFADPPYNLQLQNTLLRPNRTVVDAVDDNWDQFDDFASYDQFTREWLTACRHVLKDTGTLWVIGSYHNIYRVGAILQDLSYWFLNDVVWVKCLAGNTELYALINGRPIVSSLKDLIRIDLTENRIQLPSFDERGCTTWVDLVAWQRTEKSRGLYIEFEDGTWVECTSSHRFPVMRQGRLELVPAEKLQTDDVLIQLGEFELPRVVVSSNIARALGEFIGWYLAEGSFQTNDKGIQLSLSADEQKLAEKLLQLVQEKFGVVGRTHRYDSVIHLIFPGHFMVELVKRFVRGESAHTKRLTREAFFHGKEFLEGILDGYLQGDGHWVEHDQRWSLGLCNNRGLISDLALVCRITHQRIRFREVMRPYQRGVSEAIVGEIRGNLEGRFTYVSLEHLGLPSRRHFAYGQRYSLKTLREKYKWSTRKNPISEEMPELAQHMFHGHLRPVRIKSIQAGTQRVFYDISVTGNHIFALANGLLTHNSNPMPNFRGVRFTNAHETLLWCKKTKDQKRYTFNYHAMKMANDEKQMRSDWELALCTGSERLMVNGEKVHTTQKPEALLYRVILSSSNPGDVVLDPFFGTGTTGAVAKKLRRNFIGIERETKYIEAAQSRIDAVAAPLSDDEVYGKIETKRSAPRIPFSALLENGLLLPGQTLYFNRRRDQTATVLADGSLRTPGGERGSIHKIGALMGKQPSCNGWEHWYYETEQGDLLVVDTLREQFRNAHPGTTSVDDRAS